MRGGRSCARAGLRDGGGAGEVGLSRMRTPRHSPRPGSTAFSREERREARGARRGFNHSLVAFSRLGRGCGGVRAFLALGCHAVH